MRNFGLYEVVVIKHEDYRHYGEILSRKTPTDTYMVRMVPGHAGTLREIKAADIEPAIVNVRWVHYAKIEGPRRDRRPHPGSFPVDMLRYDHCAPLNFDIATMEIDPTFDFTCMVVAKSTSLKPPHWTPARWSSFLWALTPLHTEQLYKGTEQ